MDWGLAKVLPRGGVVDDEKAGKPDRQETVIATARSGSDDPGLSRPGSAMGTPAYMAPEQARGEGDRVDERADVFALGSILCEVLTGEPAFLGRSSGEILRKAALGDLADAVARLDACGADAELVAIAADCLAREAEDRPRHAGAVAERVTAYLGGRAGPPPRRGDRPRRRGGPRRGGHPHRRRGQRAPRSAAPGGSRSGWRPRCWLLTTAGGLGVTYLLQQRQQHAARLAQVLAEATALRDRARREAGDPAALARGPGGAGAGRGPGAGGGSRPCATRSGPGWTRPSATSGCGRSWSRSGPINRTSASRAPTPPTPTAFRDAGLDLEALEPGRVRPAAEAAARGGRDRAVGLPRRLVGRAPRARRPVAAWRKPMEAARLADPEPYRDRLRRSSWPRTAGRRRSALKALAAAPEAADLPAPTAVLLGRTLADLGQAEAAVALLRAAAGRHPGDVWVNYTLAGGPGQPAAVGPRGGGAVLHGGPRPPPRDGPRAGPPARADGPRRRGRSGLPRPGGSTAGRRATPELPGDSLEGERPGRRRGADLRPGHRRRPRGDPAQARSTPPSTTPSASP